jgi:uncharacterized protein YkwD
MARSAWISLAVAVAVALTLVMPASASERELLRASALESSILAQINAVRAKHGKAPLRLSPALSAAARSHSQAMATKGFFSHNSANGSSFSTRVRKWYGPKGYRSWAAGENLLWRSPDVDAAAAVQMWMESPPHRANLLRAGWREVGLGAIHAYGAPGAFGGLEVTVVTADFGARS